MQPHSCRMGMGCHRPPHSALTWRAGNQSLWCLILSLKTDSSALLGGCPSATPAAPFEVLEQLSSGGCGRGTADTSLPWDMATPRDMGRVRPLCWVTSLLVTHRCHGSEWLCTNISQPQVPLPWACLRLFDALTECGDGRNAGRCSDLFLWFLRLSYLTGIWASKLSCWLHPWWISAGSMNWVPINALNKNLFLPFQSLPTQVVSGSFWFVPPAIQQTQLPYARHNHRPKRQKFAPNLHQDFLWPLASRVLLCISPSLCVGWHTSLLLTFPCFAFLLQQSEQSDCVFKTSPVSFFLSLIPSSNLPHTFSFVTHTVFWTSNFVVFYRHLEISEKCPHCPPLNLPCCKRALGSN